MRRPPQTRRSSCSQGHPARRATRRAGERTLVAPPGGGSAALLGALVALIVLVPQLRLADGELMSPDAAGYLDIARRFWTHGSLSTGFNPYQFWPDRTHPFLPYVQPLYPILVGWVALIGGIRGLIAANLVLFAAACGLTTALAARFAGRATAVFAGLLVGFASNTLYSAIHPWTEPLHLLVMLAAIGAFAHPRVPRVAVGAILGASVLIRFAGVYNAAALLLAVPIVRGVNARAAKEAALILAGLLAVAVPYEAFCLLRYGALYPEYLAASRSWAIAAGSGGGSFRHGLPALVVDTPRLGAGLLLGRGVAHLHELVHVLGWGAPLGLVALAGLFGPARREPVFTTFVLQGIVSIVAIAASFAWLETIEPERYTLVAFFTLVPAGLAVLRSLARAVAKEHATKVEWALAGSLALFFAWSLTGWAYFMRIYGVGVPPEAEAYAVERNQVSAWIREHSAPDALIASDFLQDPVLTERSVVALPNGKEQESPGALENFFAVWSPHLVLTGSGDLARTVAQGGSYRPAVRTAHIYVLERGSATAAR